MEPHPGLNCDTQYNNILKLVDALWFPHGIIRKRNIIL